MTRLRAFWDYLRGTYWAVPSAMAVTAVGLSVAMIQLDQAATASLLDRLSWVYTEGPEGARAVLSTIAASMITVAGVTFSITIVGLTLASQQHAEAQHREDPTRAARHRTSRTLSNRVRVRCGRRPRRPAGGAGRPGTYRAISLNSEGDRERIAGCYRATLAASHEPPEDRAGPSRPPPSG